MFRQPARVLTVIVFILTFGLTAQQPGRLGTGNTNGLSELLRAAGFDFSGGGCTNDSDASCAPLSAAVSTYGKIKGYTTPEGKIVAGTRVGKGSIVELSQLLELQKSGTAPGDPAVTQQQLDAVLKIENDARESFYSAVLVAISNSSRLQKLVLRLALGGV